MSDGDQPERPPSSLELLKTRLSVEEGELVRRNESGGVMMRFPLDDVESVRFARPLNPMSPVTLLMAAGLVAIGFFISEYNVLTVLLYVAAMPVAVLGLFGIRDDVIVVRVRGAELRIESPDVANDIRGFVASLQPLVGGQRGSFD